MAVQSLCLIGCLLPLLGLEGCQTASPQLPSAPVSARSPSYAAALNDAKRASADALRKNAGEEGSDVRRAGHDELAQDATNDGAKQENDDLAPEPVAPLAKSKEVEIAFNQAIFAALNGHPIIGAELEKIQQARADYLTTTLFPNPELFTDVQLLPLTRPFTPTRQGGPPQQDVVLTYPIDWFLFGKRTAAMSSAHFGVHIAQAEFENLIRIRVLEAAIVFYDALEAKGLHDVARQNVDNLHQLEDVTKQAIADGGRPAIEAHRIRLDAIAAEQRLRKAEAVERGAIARLRAMMGGADLPVDIAPVGDMELKGAAPIMTITQALNVAREARPDLQSILWQRTKSEADVVLQRRLGRAHVAPSFGYTRQYQQKAIGFPDADSWNAGLAVTLPISDRNQGNVAKAAAEERRNRFQYQAALLDIEAEITAAVAELKAAEENANSVAGEQLKLAESVRDSITEAFKNGGRPLIDVLDAQRNYRETYALYVSARAEYWRALYRYFAAIGQRVNVND